MFSKILIANRGEIACRVIRTAKRLGIKTVAVYSEADRRALHVQEADEAVYIGAAPASESYLEIDAILDAISATGAEAVHPGYGFLSENAAFSQALSARNIAFIGPPAKAIEVMGDKITSKKIAQEAGVSTVPGYMGIVSDSDEAAKIAKEIGFPVMIKASAGGGGKGMRIAFDEAELHEGFQSSRNEAKASFGDDRIFIERFVTNPRHIEIQILADAYGNCISLGERECSIQRRNQKVIEEAPSPFMDEETRAKMGEQACDLARSVGYQSAGTVEFIVDQDKNFYFLEMNTRLQVEHPVTELVTGVDLVEQMIRVAAGEELTLRQEDVSRNGWAMESRIYAEDPYRNFLPSTGRLTRYRPPSTTRIDNQIIRNDTGVYEGGEISIYYDPMIAKLCSWAPDRESSINAMQMALDRFELEGISHNIPFLSAVMAHPRFRSGNITTGFIAEEYPDGFSGAELHEKRLRQVIAAAVAMHRVSEIRRSRISGRMDHHERMVGSDWHVQLGERKFELKLSADREGADIQFQDEEILHRVEREWRPGMMLAELEVDGDLIVMKVEARPEGFRIRHSGADLDIVIRTPQQAALAALMPEKQQADMGQYLLCPMPGLMVRLEVSIGDVVEQGQALCVVEAMKMENILRADRKAKIKAIKASEGDTLAVDQEIMEFE